MIMILLILIELIVLLWGLFIASKNFVADVLTVDAKHVLRKMGIVVAASFNLENFAQVSKLILLLLSKTFT